MKKTRLKELRSHSAEFFSQKGHQVVNHKVYDLIDMGKRPPTNNDGTHAPNNSPADINKQDFNKEKSDTADTPVRSNSCRF